MNTSIDREKLTAYVLGELDEAERQAVEAALEEDPEARALAEELRTAAEWTKDAFAHEPELALAPEQREEVRRKAAPQEKPNVTPFRRYGRWMLKIAAVLVLGGLIYAVTVPLRERANLKLAQEVQETKKMIEIARKLGANEVADSLSRYTDKDLENPEVRAKFKDEASRAVMKYERASKAEPAKPSAAPTSAAAPATAATAPAEKAISGYVLEQLQVGTQSQQQVLDAPAAGQRNSSLQNVEVNGAIRMRGSRSAGKESLVLGYDQAQLAQQTAPVDRLQALGYLGDAQSVPAQGGRMGGMGEGKVTGYGHVLPPNAEPPALQQSNPYNDPSKNYWPGHNTEAYAPIVENPFLAVTQNPLSTFSIDVDTASYSNLRRFLEQGTFPPPDSVRIEELVNYFTYSYEPPKDKEAPFAARVAIADCPWKPEHRLARVGIKGWEMPAQERPSSNLVFLLDVSGSMQPENKLPLVKKSMRMLAERLDERDRVALVVYAGSSGLVLPSTTGDRKEAILDALSRLEAGGSTQGSAGLQLAYETAVANFVKGGVNRVILCTDGDFNVGVTNEGDLTRMIEEKAKSGVFLSVLGFGMGNLKDSMMEKLADKGNGNYAYIDTENEARKVLVDQMQGTLVTIAKDVKIQMEFNPALVSAYRLIGYENRMLRAEDFNDDKKDAGEIGAGHTVTALYEIVPAGQAAPTPAVDALKYQQVQTPAPASTSGEMFTLKLRYKKPDGDVSTKLEFPIRDEGMKYAQADVDFKFAAAVAEFGMILRGSENKGIATFGAALELAQEGRGNDPHDYRLEFINLVKKAMSLRPEPVAPQPAVE